MAASSSSFNEGNFEKRLVNVNNTQECIQTLSLWCVHHKAHYKKIIEVWFKVFKKGKVSHRLPLFYLANDVIQNGKRKGCLQFVDAWKPYLKRATSHARDDDIKNQMERIFNIWESRSVYDASFIKELQAALGSHSKPETSNVDTKILTEFKPQKLVDRIRKFKKVEAEAEVKQKQFLSLKIDVCSTETLKTLKDKSHGQKFTHDFEEGTVKLEEFVEALQRDVKERTSLLEQLNQSDLYYETQKKEVKIVGNAYKNFGARVKNLKTKLEAFIPNLPSPIPSPSIDAPSPVDSSADESPSKNGDKDNTEAVDMEMSDDENGSVPSPDGSPVGVGYSPKAKEKHSSLLSSNAKSPGKKDKRPVGSTVASILAQISKSTPKPTSIKPNASSLDIRLSNLMQNIPNFTSSLFGGRPNFSNSNDAGGGTPVKDEESGRGSVTPLLDESREHSKEAIASENTSSLGDILQKLVSTGSPLTLPTQSTTANWNPSQQQRHWFDHNHHSSTSQSLDVRQLTVPDYNRQKVPMFMEGNFDQKQLGNLVSGQYRPSHNGDGNEQASLIERQGRPNSIGYRRNSNIVELTPSPTRGAEPLTGCNLVPLGRQLPENMIRRQEETAGINSADIPFSITQVHRSGLVQAPPFSRRPRMGRATDNDLESEYSQEPIIPSLLDGPTAINSNLKMIVPVDAFQNDDKDLGREMQQRSFSKIETVGRSSDKPIEQWEPVQGKGEQVYHQVNQPPQGWHSLNSPPPRRDNPPSTYRGFRFPRRAITPRRAPRTDWEPIGSTSKRPLLSPMRPRWTHNSGPPF